MSQAISRMSTEIPVIVKLQEGPKTEAWKLFWKHVAGIDNESGVVADLAHPVGKGK